MQQLCGQCLLRLVSQLGAKYRKHGCSSKPQHQKKEFFYIQSMISLNILISWQKKQPFWLLIKENTNKAGQTLRFYTVCWLLLSLVMSTFKKNPDAYQSNGQHADRTKSTCYNVPCHSSVPVDWSITGTQFTQMVLTDLLCWISGQWIPGRNFERSQNGSCLLVLTYCSVYFLPKLPWSQSQQESLSLIDDAVVYAIILMIFI